MSDHSSSAEAPWPAVMDVPSGDCALMPEALTPDDPVAFRSVFLGIHIDAITGREALPGSPRGRGGVGRTARTRDTRRRNTSS